MDSKNISEEKILNEQNDKLLFSLYALNENIRISSMCVDDIVKEYINLQILPINNKITINKIGVYNRDFFKRESKNLIKYENFTKFDSTNYPKGSNPYMDYMPDENISPVVIIDTNGNKFKVNYLYWLQLIDIHDYILIQQGLTNIKLLPMEVFIDVNNKWLKTLFNIIDKNILDTF